MIVQMEMRFRQMKNVDLLSSRVEEDRRTEKETGGNTPDRRLESNPAAVPRSPVQNQSRHVECRRTRPAAIGAQGSARPGSGGGKRCFRSVASVFRSRWKRFWKGAAGVFPRKLHEHKRHDRQKSTGEHRGRQGARQEHSGGRRQRRRLDRRPVRRVAGPNAVLGVRLYGGARHRPEH